MLVNRQNLLATTVAFKKIYDDAFAAYTPIWNKVAMEVPSTTRTNDYRWLAKLKGMREWIGDRVVNSLEQSGYQITNKPFENTVGVDRDDFDDDQIGLYNPMMADLGATAAEEPDLQTFGLLNNAFTTKCYDGQNFIDTDHPVTDANGVEQSVSNHGGGAGTAWYLMCTKRPVKPLIFQNRKKPQFVSLTNPDDPNVFMRKEYLYGVDMRMNVGFGLWQLCYGSKQPLTADNYAAARAAMMSMKGDNGRPLNLAPDLLVVPGTLEAAGRQVLKVARTAAGADNTWYGTADLLVSQLLG